MNSIIWNYWYHSRIGIPLHIQGYMGIYPGVVKQATHNRIRPKKLKQKIDMPVLNEETFADLSYKLDEIRRTREIQTVLIETLTSKIRELKLDRETLQIKNMTLMTELRDRLDTDTNMYREDMYMMSRELSELRRQKDEAVAECVQMRAERDEANKRFKTEESEHLTTLRILEKVLKIQ